MKDTLVVVSLSDLNNYVQHREDLAQIDLINDHIKPYSANKARSLIAAIKRGCSTIPRRKGSSPREIKLRVIQGHVADGEFADLEQLMVREQ